MRHLTAALLISTGLALPISFPTYAEESKIMTSEQSAVLATITKMTQAFEQGDIDETMSVYDTAALVAFEPGQPVQDPVQLRAMFAEMAGMGPKFTYGAHEVQVIGDMALHISPWKMQAKLPDGTPVQQSGLSVAVLRKRMDGQWKIVIDNPHGGHTMGQ